MRKLKYTFKTDTLFKMLFVKYPCLLKALVAALLGILPEDIWQFEIRNGEIAPENLQDKFCRLDINMIVNGELVDLEVQVSKEKFFPERGLLYWAREYSSALPSGEEYSMLPRTIVISILDFNLFNSRNYHSFFQPLEVTTHELLSDKMGIHFFELRKLPKKIDKKDPMQLWLALFNARTEEDLEEIEKMEVPEMNQAINAYRIITASSEFREIERLREKARHDEAQALSDAREEAEARGRAEGRMENKIEIARNLLKIGIPLAQIAAATGLTAGEVERLHEEL